MRCNGNTKTWKLFKVHKNKSVPYADQSSQAYVPAITVCLQNLDPQEYEQYDNVTEITNITSVIKTIASGTVTPTSSVIVTPTGGVATSGSATCTFSIIVTPTGGSVASGLATCTFSVIETPTGGISASGLATYNLIITLTPTGGALANGAADSSVTAGVVNEIQRWNFSGDYNAGTAEVQHILLNASTSGNYTLSISGVGVTGNCVGGPSSWADQSVLASELETALNAILPYDCSVVNDLPDRLAVTFSARMGDVASMIVVFDSTDGGITQANVTDGVETSKTTWSYNGDEVTYYYYLDDVQDTADLLYGVGNVNVTATGAGQFDFEFIGSLAGTDVVITEGLAVNYTGSSTFRIIQNGGLDPSLVGMSDNFSTGLPGSLDGRTPTIGRDWAVRNGAFTVTPDSQYVTADSPSTGNDYATSRVDSSDYVIVADCLTTDNVGPYNSTMALVGRFSIEDSSFIFAQVEPGNGYLRIYSSSGGYGLLAQVAGTFSGSTYYTITLTFNGFNISASTVDDTSTLRSCNTTSALNLYSNLVGLRADSSDARVKNFVVTCS